MIRSDHSSPLSRPLRVEEIAEGAAGEVAATESELAAIAAFLDLRALENLIFTYRIHSGGGGRLHLSGELKADVTQTCVVSLEPVKTSLDVPVETEFWPEALLAAADRNPEYPGSAELADWPEPIVDGKIDLGPLIYESLALALDPYPRREGARFEWSQEKGTAREPGTGPFAALGALKRR